MGNITSVSESTLQKTQMQHTTVEHRRRKLATKLQAHRNLAHVNNNNSSGGRMNKRKMQAVIIVDPRNAIVNGLPSADAPYTDNNNNRGDKRGQDVNGKNMNSTQNNNNNADGINNSNVKENEKSLQVKEGKAQNARIEALRQWIDKICPSLPTPLPDPQLFAIDVD